MIPRAAFSDDLHTSAISCDYPLTDSHNDPSRITSKLHRQLESKANTRIWLHRTHQFYPLQPTQRILLELPSGVCELLHDTLPYHLDDKSLFHAGLSLERLSVFVDPIPELVF